MRTTLDIEDDVLLAVKQISRQRHESAGHLVSELCRTALVSKVKGRKRNGVPLFPVRPGASIVTMELVNRLRDELSPNQTTDAYLLGLAVRNGGKLATLDGSIPAEVVVGGERALEVISPG